MPSACPPRKANLPTLHCLPNPAVTPVFSSSSSSFPPQTTRWLDEEKHRSDALLYRMLPADIAADLREGHKVEPISYGEVTILFSGARAGRVLPCRVSLCHGGSPGSAGREP